MNFNKLSVIYLVIISTILGLIYSILKKNGLGFYYVDYNFYYSIFHINSGLSELQEIFMHPGGENALGFEGMDGYPYISNEIHLSLIQSPLSYLFRIGGEKVIFLVYSFFASLATILLVKYFFPFSKKNRNSLLLIFIAILPSYLTFTSFDLRVFILLMSFVALVFYAIETDANDYLVLLLIFALFLIREEFMYFGLVASIHLFWKRRIFLSIFSGLFSIGSILYFLNHFETNTTFVASNSLKNILIMVAPVITLYIFSLLHTRMGAFQEFDNYIKRMSHFFKASEVKTKGMLILFIYLLPIFAVMIKYNWFMVYKTPKYYLLWTFVVLSLSHLIRKKIFLKLSLFFFITLTLIMYSRIISKEFDTKDGFKVNNEIQDIIKEEKLTSQHFIVTDKDLFQAFVGYKAASWERPPIQIPNLENLVGDADILITRKEKELEERIPSFKGFSCRKIEILSSCKKKNRI